MADHASRLKELEQQVARLHQRNAQLETQLSARISPRSSTSTVSSQPEQKAKPNQNYFVAAHAPDPSDGDDLDVDFPSDSELNESLQEAAADRAEALSLGPDSWLVKSPARMRSTLSSKDWLGAERARDELADVMRKLSFFDDDDRSDTTELNRSWAGTLPAHDLMSSDGPRLHRSFEARRHSSDAALGLRARAAAAEEFGSPSNSPLSRPHAASVSGAAYPDDFARVDGYVHEPSPHRVLRKHERDAGVPKKVLPATVVRSNPSSPTVSRARKTMLTVPNTSVL
ncbi:uncharacterized protein MONBRDRAFT_23072 [Monosiga brevicollis MX1]|uniref:Uncharacterized protein n=1 Tax=Monosiga brevicollis TaxID=81824 RepID=A9UR41_MONBE|nr:uncharacterized protein MONBRDRAFT_23072 [Monosiga brevicollis MX1]EDQ91851.1 predicted protein [Monosiga brevicollis MX1]|eukprot:XP_001743137.1 hypothetical protein [Monosiga brevicollis MX1]